MGWLKGEGGVPDPELLIGANSRRGFPCANVRACAHDAAPILFDTLLVLGLAVPSVVVGAIERSIVQRAAGSIKEKKALKYLHIGLCSKTCEISLAM